MVDVPAGFAGLLRHLRDSAGLTQEELADRARVGVNTISELERGRHHKCQIQTARRLAVALGLSGAPGQSFIAAARGLIPAAAVPGGEAADEPPQASVTTPGRSAASPAGAAAVPEVRYSLPPDAAAFTGRDAELAQVTAALTGAAGRGGVVAVRAIGGMPGIGKTSLAVRAAHVLVGRFPDRQLFIDLHAHTPGREPVKAEDALAGLLAAAGIDARFLPGDLEGRSAMWRDRMVGQKALLVLDNAASASQVVPLLPGSGGCLVLVTSRRHLGDLPGTVVPVLLDVLAPEQAQEMFTRLAPRAAADREGVAELVALAGFLPLAICLLARVLARHPTWTVTDLAAEMEAGVLTLAAENYSVAAAFEVSYRHLDPAQQQFFRRLGLHPGTTIDVYAAAALAGVPLADAAGLLDGLNGEGLLTEVSYRRYAMHDLIRRYARDLAAADPVPCRDRAAGRLLDYYQYTASAAQAILARHSPTAPVSVSRTALPGPVLGMWDRTRALGWAQAERGNLLACLDHATGTGQHARVVAFTAAISALLRQDGPWDEAITRHDTAVQAARRLGNRPGEADALSDLGVVRQLTGDYPGAAESAQEALGIYRDLGDRLGQGNALRDLGVVRQLTGDYLGAASSLEGALGIYRDLGDRLGQGNVLCDLGVVRRLTGDYPGAAESAQEALGIYRDLGNRLGQGNALIYLGAVRRMTGDYPGAARALEEALDIYRDLGNRMGQAAAVGELGGVRRMTGDYPGAARALEEALTIFRDLGDRGSEAEALNDTGTLHRVRGDLDQARACHRQALQLARQIGSSREEACALAGLGRCALADGRTASGQDSLRQAQEIFRRIGADEASTVAAELRVLNKAEPPAQAH